MWKWVRAAVGPTFNHRCLYPTVYSPVPLNPVTSMGNPKILFSGISATSEALTSIKFTNTLVSTKAFLMRIWFIVATKWGGLLWFRFLTSMSSSVKVILLVSSRKVWLVPRGKEGFSSSSSRSHRWPPLPLLCLYGWGEGSFKPLVVRAQECLFWSYSVQVYGGSNIPQWHVAYSNENERNKDLSTPPS